MKCKNIISEIENGSFPSFGLVEIRRKEKWVPGLSTWAHQRPSSQIGSKGGGKKKNP